VGEAGVDWGTAPAGPHPQPLTVGEATASWRRRLGDPAVASGARLAALDGILALGVDPARWWFQRDWTGAEGPLHEELHVSYSRLERLDNCALQYVLSQELGLEGGSGYHAWVGHLVHRLIEDCENGVIPRSQEALVAEAQTRWRQEAFPSFAVSEAFRRLVTTAMLPAWFREFGAAPALARELRFRFEFDGATVTGVIDRVGPCRGGGTQITDYKTGKSRNAGKAADNLQLGIYYLAVNRAEELAGYRPVRAVELAFVRDLDRDGGIARSPLAFVGDGEEAFEQATAERLSGLIGRLRELQVTENYRPSTKANCRFCDFKPLCPLWPEGKELFPAPAVEVAAP
jgi:RecB family exonuclease